MNVDEEIRMECLRMAATFGHLHAPEVVLEMARDFEIFVRQPRSAEPKKQAGHHHNKGGKVSG